MSKQAMNQLLRGLEGYGYIERTDAPHEGRARTVPFTKRGRAAYAKIGDIERERRAELGSPDCAMLNGLLSRVWDSRLTRAPPGTTDRESRQVRRDACDCSAGDDRL
jgi:DNA-binding MarR family transcriptional regulator